MTTRQKYAAGICGFLYAAIAVLICFAAAYQEQKEDLYFRGTTSLYLSDETNTPVRTRIANITNSFCVISNSVATLQGLTNETYYHDGRTNLTGALQGGGQHAEDLDHVFANAVIGNGLQLDWTWVTTDITLTTNHHTLAVSTVAGASAVILPEVSTMYGQQYLIILLINGGNLLVHASTGDALNDGGNTNATMNAVDDWMLIQAVSTNRWLVINDNSVTYGGP